MSRQRKRQFRFATFVILPVVLALGAFVPAFLLTDDEANALNATEWQKVRGYIQDYIASQYQYGLDGKGNTADDPGEGEAGFVIDQTALKARIDSNGDGKFLDEGDDPTKAPVLVDNLETDTSGVIPTTSVRCLWNANCFEPAKVNEIKGKVNSHQAAGYSTDVVFYCLTGHTEAPTTGGFGYIAQAGGLGGVTPPKVFAFKWGRQGWTNAWTGTYGNTGPTGAPKPAAANNPYASNSQCAGKTPDSELVRCMAAWAIYDNAGKVGNGQSPDTSATTGHSATNPDLNAGQIVDIRAGSPAKTIADSNSPTMSVPLDSLFKDGLSKIPAGVNGGVLVAGRTQHLGGITAAGLKMLGYNMTTGGFLNKGMPAWNNTMAEQWQSTGKAYALVTPAGDNTAPTISKTIAAADDNSVKITWTTSEPATSMVEYGKSAAGPFTKVTTGCDNAGKAEACTILRKNHGVTITGLTPNTTYYYRLTSFDGQANKVASNALSFKTVLVDSHPPVISNIKITSDQNYILADYSDPAGDTSGVDTASLTVKVYPNTDTNAQPVQANCWAIGSPEGAHADDSDLYDGITCNAPAGLGPKVGNMNGNHTVEVSIADNTSNVGTASGVITIGKTNGANGQTNRDILATGETTSPATTPKHSYAGADIDSLGWQKAPFTVALTCVDGGTPGPSGCQETRYKVDNGSWATGNAAKIQYDGDHVISYYSVDNKGNAEGSQDAPKTVHAKLDRTAPVIVSISPASGSQLSAGAPIQISYRDNASGIDLNSIQVKFNGKPMTGCTKTASMTKCPWAAAPGYSGSVKIDVSLKDNAGYAADRSSSFTVTPPGALGDSFYTWYDYGNANTGLFFFNSASGLEPQKVWSSGNGRWDLARSKPVTIGDYTGDGKPELAVLYNLGGGGSGLWVFESRGTGFAAKRKWVSGAGNWDWNRSTLIAADINRDGKTEPVVFYDYGNANTGMWVFDPAAGLTPKRKWISGPGNWDMSRTRVTAADLNRDGKSEPVAFYDYGNADTGLWDFDPAAGYAPKPKWRSGAGKWAMSRARLASTYQSGKIVVLYDSGTTMGLYIFDPAPSRKWASRPGSWNWSRTMM